MRNIKFFRARLGEKGMEEEVEKAGSRYNTK